MNESLSNCDTISYCNITSQGIDRKSLLNELIGTGYSTIAENILYNIEDINVIFDDGTPAILEAVRANDKDMVSLMLSKGMNPDLMDNNYISPLLQSILDYNLEMEELLSRYGATFDNECIETFNEVKNTIYKTLPLDYQE